MMPRAFLVFCCLPGFLRPAIGRLMFLRGYRVLPLKALPSACPQRHAFRGAPSGVFCAGTGFGTKKICFWAIGEFRLFMI